jgi:hypothetical protein
VCRWSEKCNYESCVSVVNKSNTKSIYCLQSHSWIVKISTVSQAYNQYYFCVIVNCKVSNLFLWDGCYMFCKRYKLFAVVLKNPEERITRLLSLISRNNLKITNSRDRPILPFLLIWVYHLLYGTITVVTRSKLWTVLARSNAEIVDSNPTQGMDVSVLLFCVCVVLCADSGLETGWSPVQGVLPSVCWLEKLKKATKAQQTDCRTIDTRRQISCTKHQHCFLSTNFHFSTFKMK